MSLKGNAAHRASVKISSVMTCCATCSRAAKSRDVILPRCVLRRLDAVLERMVKRVSMRLEVDDSGIVVLPAELIQAAPRTSLEAQWQGNTLILNFPEPRSGSPARSLLDLPVIPTGPINPALTFRREDI